MSDTTARTDPQRTDHPLRQIRATFTEDAVTEDAATEGAATEGAATGGTITVYQAYPPAIALPAIERGRFAPEYNRSRMTWIKPSFLWMMCRSSWADSPGQEHVLAIELTRTGFHAALAQAVASSYQPRLHASQDAWRTDLRRSSVRYQWDPERDLQLRPLPWRSLQIGLSGSAVHDYVDHWITGITDVTPLAHRMRRLLREQDVSGAAALLPVERPYPLPEDVARQIDADRPDH